MEFTARQIAALVGGTVDGNPEAAVSSFAKIEEASAHDLTFLSNPKYTHYIYNTRAGVVLVSNDFQPTEPVEATMIRVADPYAVLSVLMEQVSAMLNPQPTGIESPSYIAEGVEVPEGAYIGAVADIGRTVKLGRNVKL